MSNAEFKFFPGSTNGIGDLTKAQINNGQIVWLGHIKSETESPTAFQELWESRAKRTALELTTSGVKTITVDHKALATQVESLVPAYLNNLFKELGLSELLDKKFALSVPQITNSDKNRGHYTAPFSVVSSSDEMKIFQHAVSTMIHEIGHAIGKMKAVVREGALKLVQTGIGINSTREEAKTKTDTRVFRFFEEGLMAITQSNFLVKFLGFEEIRTWRYFKN